MMGKKYNPKEIEKEAQEFWAENHVFEVKEDDDLEKFYWNLLKLGAGQWVGDFYVAGAAIIYPTTCFFIILNMG